MPIGNSSLWNSIRDHKCFSDKYTREEPCCCLLTQPTQVDVKTHQFSSYCSLYVGNKVHTCIQNFYSTMKRNVMQKAQLCYYLVDALTDLLHIFVFLFYWHSALLSYSPNNNTTTNKKMYCLAWNSPALWPFWGHFWHLATTNTVVQLISITNGYTVCL